MSRCLSVSSLYLSASSSLLILPCVLFFVVYLLTPVRLSTSLPSIISLILGRSLKPTFLYKDLQGTSISSYPYSGSFLYLGGKILLQISSACPLCIISYFSSSCWTFSAFFYSTLSFISASLSFLWSPDFNFLEAAFILLASKCYWRKRASYF